jgi:serine protease Do
MRNSNWFILSLVIILINAGITLVLINEFSSRDKPVYSMFSGEHRELMGDIDISRQNAITNAAQLVEPAVVSINVTKVETVRGGSFGFFDFFDYFPRQRQVESIGSGVIFDERGYLITNAHVVLGAAQIKVVLPDKREFDAEIVGGDNSHDIAILKISGNRIPCAKLGSSQDLIIGEWSIAVGNPYGFLMNDSKPSVSVGVISALNRNFAPRQDRRDYSNMIQTDAAINPGNSGGPLVNIYGEVVGINTFIFSDKGGNIGIGFAIPIEKVKEIISQVVPGLS